MAEKTATPDVKPGAAETGASTTSTPPKRGPGHRGAEVKDTVAEMAAKAHEISLEAGSKMAAAMKDVINAAAGLTGFVIESARDLVQYMVRRGQMTQEEADKLIETAAAAAASRPAKPAKAAASGTASSASDEPAEPKTAKKTAAKKAASKTANKPAAKKATTKKK